nr:serine/threonine-protein kinase [Oscillatoria sp. FACHB-1406]
MRERYQILQVLGRGAFGQTYAVCDLLDPAQPQYALKHYPRRSDLVHLVRASQQAFIAEARILKTVGQHPQIPQFIDAFELEGGWYLVQEAIAGQTLADYLSVLKQCDRLQRERVAISLLKDVLSILDFLHECGIIHCDLKPNNLIQRSEDARWVLIDFGNAQPVRLSSEEPSARSAIAVSPSGYLAAELLNGKPVPSSDIYALGAIAIEILTGQDPVRLQLDIDRGEPSGWQRQDTPFEQILQQMVRSDLQQRYPSAQAVLEAIEEIETGADILLSTPSNSPTPLTTLAANRAWLEEVIETQSESATAEREQLDVSFNASIGPAGVAVAVSQTHPNPFSNIRLPQFPFFVSTSVTIAAVNTAAIALGMHAISNVDNADPGEQLLSSARNAYQKGEFDRAIALAKAIPPESYSYKDSQAALSRWQKNWQQASARFQEIEQAVAQRHWNDVLTQANNFPEIAFWQEKLAPLIAEAKEGAEAEAKNLLDKAFNRARERDFARAIGYLEQISPQTTTGASIQHKLNEYRSKQRVRAAVLLQEAYEFAQNRQFTEAISRLEQIPPDTSVSAIAQTKIAEYTQKQEIKAKVNPLPALYLRVAP